MNPPSSHGRYRADFYLFRYFLMALGTFRDGKVRSHEALKLAFGINRPFKIRLNERWYECRTALMNSGTPHFMNGDGDWQVLLWIDKESGLGELLQRRVLKGRPWSLHGVKENPSYEEISQTAGDIPDAAGALRLAETLIRVYAGARPVPANWDGEVRKAVDLIEKDPGGIQIPQLADKLRRYPDTLDDDFRRVLGIRLEEYVHRRKWIAYIGFRQSGLDRNMSLRQAGLPGWDGMRERFEDRYGLDLEILESGMPFVRVYDGGDDGPVLYI